MTSRRFMLPTYSRDRNSALARRVSSRTFPKPPGMLPSAAIISGCCCFRPRAPSARPLASFRTGPRSSAANKLSETFAAASSSNRSSHLSKEPDVNTRNTIRLFVLMVLIANARFAFADSVAARKLVAAQAAFDKQDWANAAALYRELAAENPNQGAFWYAIGGAEYSRKNYAEAADAYQRAVGVGYQVAVSHYNRACCLALMGETKPACDALELAIRSGLRDRESMLRTDTDLDKIRDTEEFRSRILPAVMPETSRADAWKIDLDYLTKRVEETHYAPWRTISRDDWNAEMARIEAAAPTMKDHEIIVALMQLVVRLGDGHSATRVPHEGKLAFHTLPLRFYEFKDGVYVREADPAYAKLLGRRVVRIGATPIDQALDKVATTAQRDNQQQVRWITAANLSCVEILNALGIAKSLDTVDVTTADARGKETTVSVKAGPFPPMQLSLIHI